MMLRIKLNTKQTKTFFSVKILARGLKKTVFVKFHDFFLLQIKGQTVGSVLGITTSGLLCAHGFDNGWGSIFYLHGG